MKFREFISRMQREPTKQEIELANERLSTKKGRLIMISSGILAVYLFYYAFIVGGVVS